MNRQLSVVFRWGLACLTATLLAPSVSARVVYVGKGSLAPVPDGASWATAFTALQAGIDAARAGDEIWVGPGSYYERITLKSGVAVYGGFSGSETARSQRDWNTHASFILGSQSPTLALVTAPAGVDRSAVLDGFSVIIGSPAVLCAGGSPTIRHCTLSSNYPQTTDANQGLGGAISCTGGAAPRIADNFIKSSQAHRGSAIYCAGSSPEVVNNTIIKCYDDTGYADTSGGSIYITGTTAAPVFANNIIYSNAPLVMDTAAPGTPVSRNNLIYSNYEGTTNGSYASFIGLADPTGANGNIAQPPGFASWGHGNCHIQPSSAAKDAGDDSVVLPDDTDIDGQTRIMYDHVDIGMDESDGAAIVDQTLTIHVRPDGDDAKDGRTWATAKRTLAAAVSGTWSGDEIWVAAGTYSNFGGLPGGVGLYGGFTGYEFTREQRDPVQNVAIVTYGFGVTGGTAALPSVLDGFTFKIPTGYSGIRVSSGYSTISNNAFAGSGTTGGPALTFQGGTAQVQGCTFQKFTVSSTAGAAISSTSSTSLTVTGCVFSGNSSTSSTGGAIYLNGGTARISDCVFNGNKASMGAAVMATSCQLTFVNNTVANSLTTGSSSVGGALALSNCTNSSIANNVFAYNTSVVYLAGTSAPTFTNNGCFQNTLFSVGKSATAPVTDGNTTADAHFADAPHGNWRLQLDSPYRNAGDPAQALSSETDADGKPRIRDGRVDIGAYESDGTVYEQQTSIVRVKPDGNDTNDGSTWEKAKKTVTAALLASPNEVWLAAGTYAERVTVLGFTSVYGGFAGSETSRSQRNAALNITTLDGGQSGPVLTLRMPTAGDLDGFTVTNALAKSGNPSAVLIDSALSTVSHVTITGCGAPAVTILNAASPRILNCRFVANSTGTSALVSAASGTAPIIANSIFANNYSPALSISGGGLIAGNTIVGSGYPGTPIVNVTSTGTAAIVNNIVAYGRGYGIGGSTAAAALLKRNCVYGNSSANYSGFSYPAGQDPNLTVNPRLANVPGGNDHLQPDSPCVDAGDDSVVDSTWTDMDGQARIIGAHVDIGADESDGTVWPPFAVRVSPTGNDSNDGSMWALAKKTVQAAVTAASTAGGGEVWVAAGTYSEVVTLKSSVAVYGGFSGSEIWRSERDWRRNVSVLDAKSKSNAVIVAIQVSDAAVDGFTIRNGNGHMVSLASYDYHGGGIFLDRSSIIVSNNSISGNAAINGGAIYVKAASPTITDNLISGNKAQAGGGICCVGGSAPLIARNVITYNQVIGISMSGSSSGGGISCSASPAVITGNVVAHNMGSASFSYPTGTALGGGIAVSGASLVTITNNLVTGNSSTYGGGISSYSGLARVANNEVTGNTAYAGGGVYVYGVGPTFVNNTIVNNSGSADGGGLAMVNGGPSLVNNVIAYNSTGVYASGTMPTPAPAITNNDVYQNGRYAYSGIPDPTWQSGNVALDPQFAGLTYGDLHIQPTSPLVSAGDPRSVSQDDKDMDGLPRVTNGLVDIGAYQSDGTVRAAGPVVICVKPAGNDSNDGSTWQKAKATVTGAVEALPHGGGEVWVAAGTYPGPVTLGAFTYLYGGFAGTESVRENRDSTRNLSILDGQAKGSGVTSVGSSYGRLDGFTILNGSGTSFGNAYGAPTYGGGVFLLNSAITVANNTIFGCRAYIGGGIHIGPSIVSTSYQPIDGNAATITNNRFLSNSAQSSGGGLYVMGAARISDNVFEANAAPSGCAAAIVGPARVTNNTVVSSTGTGGSNSTGFSVLLYSTPAAATFANNIVAFNTNGVGVSTYYSTWTPLLPPNLHHNDIYGNSAGDYYGVKDPTGASGNIQADPKFANLPFGDVHVQPYSPCRDAGDSTLVTAGETDLDGAARIVGGKADIGADESDLRLRLPSNPIVRVSQTGSDSATGSSWSEAKRTVQAAIDALGYGGGEVWVARGVYAERITLGIFTQVYGGFAGTETSRGARNWASNVTVLDGGQLGSVVTALTTSANAVVDGFTIRNGKAPSGGGVSWLGGNGTLTHNYIVGNTSTNTTTNTGGGGVFVNSPVMTISNNVVSGNTAAYGGGITTATGTGSTTSVTIANNTVAGNTGSKGGGGIQLSSSAQITLTNNVVAFNTGGGIAGTSTTTKMTANDVYGNGTDYSNYDPQWANGNISLDPQFVDRANGDYHLQPTSPAVDAGMDAAVTDADLAGNARRQGAHTDMGAFESAGPRVVTGGLVVRVKPGGNDANDGSSWDAAMKTVSAALGSVRTPGGEVWVAAGTYMEHAFVRGGVGLYGGFAGTETARDQRDPSANVTTLDGEGKRNVVFFPASAEPGAVLDGFTITHGYGSDFQGGGVSVEAGSPVVCNNHILANQSGSGAGVYVGASATPLIEGNMIEACGPVNTSKGYTDANSAGVYSLNAAPVIRNNTIVQNTDGGIFALGGAPVITGNTISRNRAIFYGAAVFTSNANATIAGNLILHNYSNYGGAVRIVKGAAAIRDNVIAANTGPDATTSDGRMGCAGILLSQTTANLANNTVAVNAGTQGGALNSDRSTATLINNIIAHNASGIYKAPADPSVIAFQANCFYQNLGYHVSGLTDPMGSNANFAADPRLADIANDDFRIQPDSPCRDAGDNAAVQAGDTDAGGNPRILPTGGRVDIGAYESDGAVHPPRGYSIRVKPDGNDAADGQTWDAAKKTIGAALAALPAGGAVWIAGGNYSESVTLQSFQGLYGGFAGTEGSLAERNTVGHETVLTGKPEPYGQPICPLTTAGGSLDVRLDRLTVRSAFAGIQTGAGGVTEITGSTVVGCQVGMLFGAGSEGYLQGNTIAFNTQGIQAVGAFSLTATNNRFLSNGPGTVSGQVVNGGGLLFTGGTARIADNLLAGNGGALGGGVYLSAETVQLDNNTFAANDADQGAAVYVAGGSLLARNNIISGNASGICADPAGAPNVQILNNCFFANAAYTVQGLPNPLGKDGNILADPRFAGPAIGEFHLLPDSPCRNAGANAAVMTGDTDLDGSPRIEGGTVDMGAYEADGAIRASSRIVRVKAEGNDASDGSSWDRALRTIQAAANIGGDIWIAAGAYAENVVSGPFASFYGGFAGNETLRSQRDPVANVTNVDGGGKGPVFALHLGARPVTVDGFTIANGNGQGSALNATGRPLTFSHNVVTGNVTPYGYVINAGSSAHIAYNRIEKNSGDVLWAGSGSVVEHNTVTGNTGTGITVETDTRVSWNTVQSNTAGVRISGGLLDHNAITDNRRGVNANAQQPITISDNVIARNTAGYPGDSSSGGGLWIYTGLVEAGAEVRLYNNTITGNSADHGGAVYTTVHDTVLVNNIIALNSSGVASGRADAVVALRNNCFFGQMGADFSGVPDPSGADGNIHSDPTFANRFAGDYRLTTGSLCIDAGDDAVVEAGDTDLMGQPRIQPSGGRVDIGAYEGVGADQPVPPATIRVRPDGNDANDGSTWDKAMRTVQAGLNAAALTGGEVWVATGTYKEGLREGIVLPSGTSLYGGFTGVESLRSQRDPIAYPTVLDGDLIRTVLTVQGGFVGETVDGFTIQYGAPSSINVVSSLLTLSNCRIVGPSIEYSGSDGLVASNSAVTVTACTVTGHSGSGIRLSNCSGTLSDSTISYNAQGVLASGTCSIVHNTIYHNLTPELYEMGGGINCATSGRIAGNYIVGNSGYQGGGLWIQAGDVSNNVIAYNTGVDGAAIYVNGPATFTNNSIIGNRLATDGYYGISIYASTQSQAATFVNNIVAFNAGGVGLTTYNSAAPVFRHNDFYSNGAPAFTGVPDPIGTDANFASDPRVVDWIGHNYRLTAGSPCINAGDNSVVAAGDLDLDSLPRISGGTVDLGAYEYQPSAPLTAAEALRVFGGMEPRSSVGGGSIVGVRQLPAARIDIVQAVRLARKAAGLDQAQ